MDSARNRLAWGFVLYAGGKVDMITRPKNMPRWKWQKQVEETYNRIIKIQDYEIQKLERLQVEEDFKPEIKPATVVRKKYTANQFIGWLMMASPFVYMVFRPLFQNPDAPQKDGSYWLIVISWIIFVVGFIILRSDEKD